MKDFEAIVSPLHLKRNGLLGGESFPGRLPVQSREDLSLRDSITHIRGDRVNVLLLFGGDLDL